MRYLIDFVKKDLLKKMVFISGPRQCGKTTFVKGILNKGESLYLNWDDIDDRKIIQKREWNDEDKVIALDEIHKYSRWKNFLKGTYDKQKEKHNFIITGSARLDLYKKGQDSMVGRFFSWRLHPLCLAELKTHFGESGPNAIDELLEFSGFPEPFFSKDLTFVKRWRKERINLVFRQDILEIENIRDISLLEMFYQVLTERVSSEIILSNIAHDLEIAPKTAKNWLGVLEKSYALFTVYPYSSKSISKSIVKAPKVYFYDNGEVVGDLGAKFENLVANHLYKKIHFLQDSTGDSYSLHYLRDRDKHEVDFLVVKNRKPYVLIESKVSDLVRSKSLYYYKDRLKVDRVIQLVFSVDEIKGDLFRKGTKDGITIRNARDWLSKDLNEDFIP